jgi:hypothetical protein
MMNSMMLNNPQSIERRKKKILELILCDVTAEFSGCLGRIENRENIISLLKENLFDIEYFEDFTHALQAYWGQLIFDLGAEAFYCSLGVDPGVLKRVKCGYFLIIAQRAEAK